MGQVGDQRGGVAAQPGEAVRLPHPDVQQGQPGVGRRGEGAGRRRATGRPGAGPGPAGPPGRHRGQHPVPVRGEVAGPPGHPVVAVGLLRRGGRNRRDRLGPAAGQLRGHPGDKPLAGRGERARAGQHVHRPTALLPPAGELELGEPRGSAGAQLPLYPPERGHPDVGVRALQQAPKRPGIVPPGGVEEQPAVPVVEREEVEQGAQLGVLELVQQAEGEHVRGGRPAHRGRPEALHRGRTDALVGPGVPERHHRPQAGGQSRRRSGVVPGQHPPRGPEHPSPPLDRGGVEPAGQLQPRQIPVWVEVVQVHLEATGRRDPDPPQRQPTGAVQPEPRDAGRRADRDGAGRGGERGRAVRRRHRERPEQRQVHQTGAHRDRQLDVPTGPDGRRGRNAGEVAERVVRAVAGTGRQPPGQAPGQPGAHRRVQQHLGRALAAQLAEHPPTGPGRGGVRARVVLDQIQQRPDPEQPGAQLAPGQHPDRARAAAPGGELVEVRRGQPVGGGHVPLRPRAHTWAATRR
jgi:hypothetical protein